MLTIHPVDKWVLVKMKAPEDSKLITPAGEKVKGPDTGYYHMIALACGPKVKRCKEGDTIGVVTDVPYMPTRIKDHILIHESNIICTLEGEITPEQRWGLDGVKLVEDAG